MGLLSILNLPRPQAWPAVAGVPATVDRPGANGGVAVGGDDDEAEGPSKVRFASPAAPAPSRPSGTSVKAHPVMDITDSQGVETTKNGARPIAVKVEPKDLKARLDARDKALRDAYAKLAKAQTKLEDEIPKRNGDVKATMQAQKADLDKAIGNIDRQLKQVDADRKAVSNPATDVKTMNDIVARAKSPEPIGKAVEVDKHDDPLEKSPLKKQTTTTTTEVKDGKSTTTVNDKSISVGPGGVTKKQVDSTEQVSATGKTTSEASKTTTVGKDGVSHERVKKESTEVKGQTTSTETKTKFDVGPGGAGVNVEQKKTAADGSSKTTAGGVKGERGDGNLGVTGTASHERKDADGNTTKGGGTARGGLTSKDGGVGGYGSGEGSLERKGANGMATGVVGGLNGAIWCNVKPIMGEVPPKYEVSIRVNLGASIKANGGYDKEGGPVKAGATVSGGATVWMQNSWRLEEGEAQAFVAALRNGGIGGGSQRELAIIRIGLSKKGWPEAQRVFLGMPVGNADDVASMKPGEKKTIGRKTTVGGSVNGDGGGAGLNVNAERTNEREMTVTKGDDGSATYDTSQGQGDKRGGGITVTSGLVGGGFGIGKTVTTKHGYKFCVKPGMKNERELQDQIARLANAPQAEVDAFAKAHPETVVERRDIEDKSKETTATVSVGPVNVGFSDGHGVENTVRRDAQGNIIGTEQRGHNEGGMNVKAGNYQVGSQIKEESKAREDAAGDRVVDFTREDTHTDAVKFLDSLPLVGSKKKSKDKGALATASGAEDEEGTTSVDLDGLTTTDNDLKALVGRAKDRAKWNRACHSFGRDGDDWEIAARKIAKAGNDPRAVEKALHEFIGGDSMRRQVVLRAFRPDAESKAASLWSFAPENLKAIQQSYLDNAVAESQKRVVEAGKKDPAKGEAMAKDLVRELERLANVVRSTTGNMSAQAEMLSTINSRITKVQLEQLKLQGVDPVTAKKKVELDEFKRLLSDCQAFQNIETDLYAKIEAEFKKKLSNADPVVVADMTVELKTLYARWTPEYEKMATAAQKNGWQKDYFRFRPDTKRLQYVIQTSKPGTATGPTPDTVDRTKPKAPPRSREEVLAESETNFDKYKKIKNDLKATRADVKRLASELKALYEKEPLPQARTLFNRANAPVSDADQTLQTLDLNRMPDVFAVGPGVLQKLHEGRVYLRKARALYPN